MKTNKMLDKLALDEMVNKAVHNAFIMQSVVLVNSLQNLIKKVTDGSIHIEPGYVGPTFTSPDASPPRPIPPPCQSAGTDHASN